ncbi:uncharacterized protein LOC113558897 [Rhopalosiphum maidis]|uniref:uncharacterized protein LOC113558897 n=1 Tax=Rhopalosiphum maidis TaxID=43146 RepID=UPI000EFF7BA4|nr:uncharacterized protein LOC113558897 [Rhopalosiphum maidis]
MAPRKFDDIDDDLVHHKKQLKQNTLKMTKSCTRTITIRNSISLSFGNDYLSRPNYASTSEQRVITNAVTQVIQDVEIEISTEMDITEKISKININSPEIAGKEGSHDVNIDSSTMSDDEVNDTLQ